VIKLYITDILKCDDILPCFSSYRINKLSKTEDLPHRFQSATAERLLCFAAKKEGYPLPLEIKTNSFGKPYTDNFYFNISHSNQKILVAISDSEIGVDLQKVNCNQNLKVARKFLTEEENKNIDVETFFKFFTMKESYFKMTGKGLPLSPVSFKSFEKCFFETLKFDSYFISVCSRSSAEFSIENVSHSALQDF